MNTTERRSEKTTKSLPRLPEDTVAVIPVRNMVLFPGVIIPIAIGRDISIAAAQYALRTDSPLGVVLQRDPKEDEPSSLDLHAIGTLGAVLRYVTGPEGAHNIVCQGEQRFRITGFLSGYPFLAAKVERIPDPDPHTPHLEARLLQLKEMMAEVLELLPQAPSELLNAFQQVTAAGVLSDLVASFMDLAVGEKQEILEILDPQRRMDRIIELLRHRIEVLRISKEINEQTKHSMDERQREFVLREQLRTIQKELGETDERSEELGELREAIAKADMPEEAENQALKELKRLERMPDASGEYSMIRTYLDWLVELPWSAETEDRLDMAEARRVLDEDHYGLVKVKKRILEYLAVKKLNPEGKSPILCFVGPPGVGKTSLGQSIARAMGRKFVRVSLGGVHDEAEIRGHRRTYIGALPGNIIQGIRKAEARNCLMMLDEIDKLGASFHGDPSSALLEVLDPEQNGTFRDNYLAVPFDLSRVLFIATANMLDTVPGPLLDRMEVIHLPGYTADEKLQIAHRYLVEKQRGACGLRPEQCEITDAALVGIVSDYTREAGVRNLEREIGSVFRHVAVRIAEEEISQLEVTPDQLQIILGPRRFENEAAMRTSLPGVATGLAWTPVGGDILFIEANRAPGTGKLILTGQLGDVMKESAQTALTLVKSRASEWGVEPGLFEKSDIHIHVPAGATPKDGPSAGVAMFVSLASLLSQRPVRSDTAMTGEISLRGLVLPVGGVKEKVLAALAAGLRRVLLPARNRKELEEIPAEAKEKLEFVWLETVDEGLREALGG
ncbi:endopeptidase La [Methylomagnum sp.]